MPNHNERVKCEQKYHALFRDLYNGNTHVAFFLCAGIGYARKCRLPIERITDSFWSQTMDPDEFTCCQLMLFEERGMSASALDMDNAKDVIALAQEYANAGMDILINEVMTDFVEKNKQGVYEFADKGFKDLPKIILCWLSDSLLQAEEPTEVEVIPES